MKFAHTMHAAALGLLTAFSIQVAAQSVDTRPADEPRRTAGQTTEDAAITAKVKSALISDDLVKARRIDVDTKWGVVSLSGSVGSDAEREQAMKVAARIEGVRGVRTNLSVGGRVDRMDRRADVDRPLTPSGRGEHRSVGQTAGDAGLTARVKAALTDDDIVKARNIDVDTRRGVVSLSGRVESKAEHDQAIRVTRMVEGVRSVRDNLRIGDRAAASARPATVARADQPRADRSIGRTIDDAAITTKVKAAFVRDDLVKARNIDVDTRRGVVSLKGNVASNAEREQAVRVARRVEGVRSVQANLRIGQPSASTGASAPRTPEHSKPVSE